jgi:glycerol kinase
MKKVEDAKKITDQQLETVRKHQSELNEILINIGVIESQKHSMLHNLAEVNRRVEEYKSLLEEEYGPINISLEDGSYAVIEKTS